MCELILAYSATFVGYSDGTLISLVEAGPKIDICDQGPNNAFVHSYRAPTQLCSYRPRTSLYALVALDFKRVMGKVKGK